MAGDADAPGDAPGAAAAEVGEHAGQTSVCDASGYAASDGEGFGVEPSTYSAAPVATHSATARSWRDATMEEELFERGAFADVAFQFPTGGLRVLWIYGQSSVFAALSPVLRELLWQYQGSVNEQTSPSRSVDEQTSPGGQVCRCVVLHPEITMRAFQEVARYAYGLPARWTAPMLPEVLLTARLLDLPELEDLASAWGLDVILGDLPLAPTEGSTELRRPACGCEDALCSLERLCAMEPRPPDIQAWREAVVHSFPAKQVLAAVAELELSPGTLRELLEAEPLHADAGELWQACVKWAHARAGHDQSLSGPLRSLMSVMSGSRSPRFMCSLETLPPIDLRHGAPPRRLFGKAARLCQALAPPPPGEEEVAWQGPLLDIVDRVRFQDMPPPVFAAQVEALNPVMPRLRQQIYACRRLARRECGEQEQPTVF